MHEFSLCQELVDVALGEMAKLDPPATRLRSARLLAGALRAIEPETMRFAFEVLTKNTPAEGAVLDITIEPITARCKDCGWHGEIEDAFFRCDACGSTALDVLTGKELCLMSLEIERDE